jgi:glycine C-acetyltransferase
MLGDAKLAHEFGEKMLAEGIYAIGFSYPVVAQGKSRIRVQICASHSEEDITKCINAFEKIGKSLNVI